MKSMKNSAIVAFMTIMCGTVVIGLGYIAYHIRLALFGRYMTLFQFMVILLLLAILGFVTSIWKKVVVDEC